MASGGTLGDLLVTLGLDAAEFVKGLTKAEYDAKKSMEAITGAIGTVKHALGLLGVGISVHAFESMITGALEAEAALEELGKRAGLTGEQVSQFMRAARLSHTDLETVVNMSARLSKALLESGQEGKRTGAAFKALGFTSAQLAEFVQDPAKGFFELSKAMADLPETGTKAAAQLLFLGRGGANVSAVMSELAKQTELVAVRSQEEILAAKELVDRISDMEARATKLKTTLANALVPVLDDVFIAFEKLLTGPNDVQHALNDLKEDGSIKEFARDVTIAAATVAEALIVIGKHIRLLGNDFQLLLVDAHIVSEGLKALDQYTIDPGLTKESTNEHINNVRTLMDRRGELIRKEHEYEKDLLKFPDISGALRTQYALSDAQKAGVKNLPQNADARDYQAAAANEKIAAAKAKAAKEKEASLARAIAEKKGKDHTDRSVKEQAEQDLHAQEVILRQEQDLLKDQGHFLDQYYRDDLVGIKDYYSAKIAIQEDANRNILAAYDKEIEIQTKLKNDTRLKPEDRIAAETKLEEIIYKRYRAQIDGQKELRTLTVGLTHDERDYLDAVAEVDAKMKELAGDTAAAAEIRFKVESRKPLEHAAAQGDTATAEKIRALGEEKIRQAALNDATRDYQRIQEDLGIAQARIDLAEKSGAITSLDAINARSAKVTEFIGKLQTQLAVEEAIAQTLKGQDQINALRNIEQLKLAIDQLAESANELDNTFRHTFVEGFSSNLADAVDGTKKLGQAARDMARSWEQAITKMATQNIAESLFGKEGAGGFLPKFFADLFGNKGLGGVQGAVEKISTSIPDNVAQAAGTNEVAGTFVDKLLSTLGIGGAKTAAKTATGATKSVATAAATESLTALSAAGTTSTAALTAFDAATTATATSVTAALTSLVAAATAAATALSAIATSAGAGAVGKTLDGVGAKVADNLDGAFKDIQLPNFKSTATKVADNLDGAFNDIRLSDFRPVSVKVADNLDDAFRNIELPNFKDIGTKVADNLDGAFSGITLPDFKDVGSKISDNLDGVFSGIELPNFKDMGGEVTDKLNAAFDSIQTPDLSQIGNDISDSLEATFSGITAPDLSQVGRDVSNSLALAFSGLDNIDVPEFDSASKDISDNLAAAFDNIDLPDFEGLGSSITDNLRSAVDDLDLTDLGTSFADHLGQVFDSLDLTGIGSSLVDTLGDVVNSIQVPTPIAAPVVQQGGDFLDTVLGLLGLGGDNNVGADEAIADLAEKTVATTASTAAFDAALVTSSAGVEAAMAALIASATAASSALAAIAASSASKAAGGLLKTVVGGIASGGSNGFGSLDAFFQGAGRAVGGPVSANQSYIVGEEGPEVFKPYAAGNIVPNDELVARRVAKYGDIHISISVPGNTSRATADQIALRTAAALRGVTQRDG